MQTIIPIIGTLLGVVVGGFLNPVLSGRCNMRTRGRVAASQALEGVMAWRKAIEHMREAPGRLSSKDSEYYDVFLATELGSYKEFFSSDWWTENRADLYGVATPDQLRVIRGAAQASKGIKDLFVGMKEAGEEARKLLAGAKRDPNAFLNEQGVAREGSNLDEPQEGVAAELAKFSAQVKMPTEIFLVSQNWQTAINQLQKLSMPQRF
ncbi:hypothetical protein ACFPK1_03295 [Actinomycetospora rhizophila]|uniref:Uncharacterized protein n=1 Tax=Actinomycetospora rhizophila TaxID=1416876 RepID=A0ABV9Z7D7_9PSEU